MEERTHDLLSWVDVLNIYKNNNEDIFVIDIHVPRTDPEMDYIRIIINNR